MPARYAFRPAAWIGDGDRATRSESTWSRRPSAWHASTRRNQEGPGRMVRANPPVGIYAGFVRFNDAMPAGHGTSGSGARRRPSVRSRRRVLRAGQIRAVSVRPSRGSEPVDGGRRPLGSRRRSCRSPGRTTTSHRPGRLGHAERVPVAVDHQRRQRRIQLPGPGRLRPARRVQREGQREHAGGAERRGRCGRRPGPRWTGRRRPAAGRRRPASRTARDDRDPGLVERRRRAGERRPATR